MEDTKLLKLLSVVNIFLFICLVSLLIFVFREKKEAIPIQVLGMEEEIQIQKEEVITKEEIKYVDFTVSVCAENNCVWIPSFGLVNEGIVNEALVSQKVLEIVFPFFEEKYGGKAQAKNRAGNFLYWKNDSIPNLENINQRVLEAFKSGTDITVNVSVMDLPSTDGKYSNRYIEIDNSRQKLYAWVDGKVQKEILLSAAKSGYEVYGVFPIIDKGIAPIAPSGRYMPYWMAFYYSPKQDTYYGLHALIWWYDENGKKVYEPDTNIGIRRSRGCIRMLLDDAKYLYNIFQKGDPVLIHE